ncbi:MAG TPA: hypothetical protein VFR37_02215, partial [Longimicrobium sp.]|nr:hypothetical protein [Longimicrobium sp.]
MPRRRASRVYWRGGRAYGFFEDFADVGGGRERLVAEGEKLATKDPDVADALAASRVRQLEAMRRDRSLIGASSIRIRGFEEYADEHLAEKQEAGAAGDRWMANVETHLRRAMEFFHGIAAGRFGTREQHLRLRELIAQHGDVPVSAIGQDEVRAWMKHLKTMPGRDGRKLSAGAQRQHLNSLSSMLQSAVDARLAADNPVRKIKYKPVPDPGEADFFEVPEAALVLEACRVWEPDAYSHAVPFLYELVATYLFTGVRKTEGFGLEIDDLQFRMDRVRVGGNDWRGLKSERARRRRGTTAERLIPMWPQYRRMMEDYLSGPRR